MYRPDRLSPPLERVGEVEAPVEPWRKALLDAADLIRTGGHCKCALQKGDAHCAAGAIFFVTAGDAYTCVGPGADDAINALERHIGGRVVPWNNAPERTASEVIAAFEGAARS